MYMTFPVVACVALLGLQGCCKRSEASGSFASADPSAPVSDPVPLVETSKPSAQQRTYTMDWPGDGKLTYLRIKQVVVSPDATSVTIMLKNDTGNSMSVSTSPPGNKESFYIQRADHKKRFKLVHVEGIPLSPQRTNVSTGATLQFTLTFEPIEPTMTVFDVYEGDEQKPGTTYWNFSDVKLR